MKSLFYKKKETTNGLFSDIFWQGGMYLIIRSLLLLETYSYPYRTLPMCVSRSLRGFAVA